MLRAIGFGAVALACSLGVAASAAPSTFGVALVTARQSLSPIGRDAGVDVTGGSYVRVTASGTIVAPEFPSCGGSVGPMGCTHAVSFARALPTAPMGELVAAFSNQGRLVGPWMPIGTGNILSIPRGAARLNLRINGVSGREYGSFHVVSDVVASSAVQVLSRATLPGAANGGARAIRTLGGPAHILGAQRPSPTGPQQVTPAGSFTRAQLQYLLRRFGFSDTPEDITALAEPGGPGTPVDYGAAATAWLNAQLNPSSIDDSQLANYIEPIPSITGNSSTDSAIGGILERRLLQREVATRQQLLEKVTLHWLEHFSVSASKVNDSISMAHYEQTVRADALGNFAKLVTDVAKEPAMLEWLDNNYNYGGDPVNSPPNENFGRELMQLYVLGVTQLHMDGTPYLDPTTQLPVPSYGEQDVKAVALALTGFQVNTVYPAPTGPINLANLAAYDPVTFSQSSHAKSSSYSIIGQVVADPGFPQCSAPGQACIVDNVVASLARNPTTAPFEAKELIQRFATENPSPGYVSRVAQVWVNAENAPDQIAQVIRAIATDPEFYASQGTTVKEPIEYAVDAIRALHGANANPTAGGKQILGNVLYDTSQMQQELWYPPSVFSFYRPGEKEALLNNSELLARWNDAADLSNNAFLTPCTSNCQLVLNLSQFAHDKPNDIASYLLDALVGGGTPELHALVANYLANGPSYIQGAVWIVLSSPEYEEN